MRLLWKLVILLPLINSCAGEGRFSRPIFIQEPQDVIFPLDLSRSEIILTCTANGYPSPHYRWKQNGTDIDFSMTYHYRLDGGSLAISSPRTDQDIGTYQCLATNPVGTILSRKAKLQFAYIEDFETKTRSTVSVREGQGVVLLCGPPPHFGVPDISWRRLDGSPMPGKVKYSKSQAILEIPNFQQEDEGFYECIAGNLRGRNLAKGQLVFYGFEISVLVDKVLVIPERIQIENGTFIITMLNVSDSGIYQCAAENKYQTIYANAELRVLASAPDFSKKPIKKISVVQVGGDISIECKPNAFPKASISWKRGAETLRQSKRVFLLEDGSLKICNVTRSDAGSYTCVATNQFGNGKSSGSLIVKERTVITIPPSKMDVTVGESIVLPCQVSHDPTMEVVFVWYFNGDVIDLKKGVAHFERIGGESVGDLMIRNIQLGHSGKYLCTVQTTLERLSAVADIIVRGPPGPPEDVKVEHISSTTSQLSWRPGPDNNSPIQIFTIQTRTPFSVGWQAVATVPEILNGQTYNATVVGLSPWVEYEFRVVAGNNIGIGEPSKPSELLRTKASVPIVAPVNINGGGGSRSELVITWESIPEELQNGEGFGYIVMFRPVGSTTWMKERVALVESSRFIYRNESIMPLSPFEVKVGVYNNEGEGSLSTVSIVYSGEDEPQLAPRGTSVQSFSASEMEVSWNAIAWNRNTGRVLGYEVLYWTDNSKESMIGKTRVSGNVTTKNITGLRANTIYFASVRAYNTAGTGPSSPPVNVTTKKSLLSSQPGLRKSHTYLTVLTSEEILLEALRNPAKVIALAVVALGSPDFCYSCT
nr:contactin-6-like [Meriones unguiculatus]